MAKRTLRIMHRGVTAFAVCGWCHAQFESKFLNLCKAQVEIQAKYDEHKCKREDLNQTDARTVRK
jgi:hypothetical protein